MKKLLSVLLLGFVITGCQSVAVKENTITSEDNNSFNISEQGEAVTTLFSLIAKDKIAADAAAKKMCKSYTFYPNFVQLENGLKRYNVQCEFHMIK